MTTLGRYRAILFDFDGVLADTMEDNFLAWKQVLHEVGADIEKEEYFLLEGMKLAEVARLLCERYGVRGVDYADIVKKKEASYIARHSFRFYQGVQTFIGELAEKKVPIAIVSAGLYSRLSQSVPTGFLEQFQAVITGEKTERNKPFPDPYERAAFELNIPINECIVVENAPLGIQSAKAAGAYCIAISSTLGEDKLKEADQVIGTFADLKNVPLVQDVLIGH